MLTTQTPQFRSVSAFSAIGTPPKTADSRTCDNPMNASGPQNDNPRVNPDSSMIDSYWPVARSTYPKPPVPECSRYSRPLYHRGECDIDNPRAIFSPVGTSISTPPSPLFCRQPFGSLVSPSAVT